MTTTIQTGLAAPGITAPFDFAEYYGDTKGYIGKLPKTYETHFGDGVRFFVEINLEPNESQPNFDFCSEVDDMTTEVETYRQEARTVGSRAVGQFLQQYPEYDAKRESFKRVVECFAFSTALAETLGVATKNRNPKYRRMAQLVPPHLESCVNGLIKCYVRSMPDVRPIWSNDIEEPPVIEQEHSELAETMSEAA